MAKSQQTFSKSEKEKKRLKKRQDKQKKMEWFIKHHKKIYSNIGNTKYFKIHPVLLRT